VLSGELLFHVGGAHYRRAAGDGILIDSQPPHRAENACRGQAHVLMTGVRPAEAAAEASGWPD
jgi:quercetin dioxygenase-like cupin family protein